MRSERLASVIVGPVKADLGAHRDVVVVLPRAQWNGPRTLARHARRSGGDFAPVRTRQGEGLFRGEFNRKSVLEELGKRHRFVHLATHAILDERAPLRSGIVLSKPTEAEPDGGLLQVREFGGITDTAPELQLTFADVAPLKLRVPRLAN